MDNVKGLLEQKMAKRVGFSIWLDHKYIQSVISQPAWVSHCFQRQDTRFLHSNCRIFSCPEGHRTSWHYDTNLLFNFNLQLQGQKKWTLVSPNKRFRYYGFSSYGLVNESAASAGKKSSAVIILNPGDMLYVPPLWTHEVESVHENSLSISWIGANEHAIVPSRAFEREKELLRLACWLKKIKLERYLAKLSGGNSHFYSQYSGQGWGYIQRLVANVTYMQVLIRTLKELCRLPSYFLDRKEIRKFKIKPRMIW